MEEKKIDWRAINMLASKMCFLLFLLIIINKMKRIKPSKKASYNCEGCLGNPYGSVGKINPHVPSVGLPYNSPLIKFPILTKPKPIGIAKQIESDSLRNEIEF